MRPLTTLFVTLLTLLAPALGQELSVYNVVTDAYPRITANYFALDETGATIDDLTARDFRVIETTTDGKNVDLTSTVSHNCITNASSTSASVVLIVDESLSMDQLLPSGKRRIEYVKEALRAFVDRLPWNGETAVSIIGFSGKSRLLCDWQTTPGPVLAAIGRLTPLSATNYEVSFLGIPNVFDQMQQRTPSIPKVAFFITDGAPNPDIAKRQEFEQKVITLARAQGIRIFSVTLMINRTDPSIATICRSTGGRSMIATEESLVNLVGVLALEAISKKVCTISWISPLVCNDDLRMRTATIQLRRGRQPDTKVYYTTPDSSLVRLEAVPSTLVYGDIPPLQSLNLTCTVTAVNTDLSVTSASISTPAYFQLVGFSPFTLKKGESKQITVKFTQGADRVIRTGTLTLAGNPLCIPVVTLVAGGGNVILTSPNGGDVLSTCTETRITWTGVPSYQPVTIEYSCDGVEWVTLADTALGGSFPWKPTAGCPTGRIRVRTLSGERYIWASRTGGMGTEEVNAIDVAPDGSRIYIGGSFIGQTEFGPTTANAVFNAADGYVTELDNTGAVLGATLLKGDIGSTERIVRVATDRDGNVYVAGTVTGSNITYGLDRWTRMPSDLQNAFIYKFRSNGTLLWRITLGGNEFTTGYVDINSLEVKPNASGDIEATITGTCEYIVSARGYAGTVLDEVDVPDLGPMPYSVTISSAGQPNIRANFDAVDPSKDDPLSTTDRSGYHYATGSYRGNYTVPLVPPVTLSNKGQSDVWVTKSTLGVSTEDVSDKTFRIVQPILKTDLDTVRFDSTAIGRASTQSSTTALRNIGTAPLMIDSVIISGPAAKDFAVIDDLDSVILDTGAIRSLEISFSPTVIGTRRARITIYGSCENIVFFDVEGEGRLECPWILQDTIDMGRQIVGTSTTQRIDCILKSERRGTVRGFLAISGSSDFQVTPSGVFTLKYGECISVRVTFTPTIPGPQQAQIDLNLPTECGIAFTQIFGEGIKPELSVSSIDLGNKRLRTVSMDTINIVNNGTVDVEVTSLNLVDTAGTGFSATLPSLPVTIGVSDTIRIPITFIPTTRGSFVSSVLVDAKGVDSTLIGTMHGFGYQPICEARGYSFLPVLTGTVSNEPGFIRIWNRDATWPLHIDGIQLPSVQSDFTWSAVPGPFPLILAPNDSVDVFVTFSPQGAGLRAVNIDVLHDGRPGPEDIPPYARTEVLVDGVGLQRSVLPPVLMDTILSCLTDTAVVELVNDDPTTSLLVPRVVATGDVGAFRCEPPPPFTIPAGGAQEITVIFTPPDPRRFAATFAYENPRSLDLTINVSGTGTSRPISIAMSGATTATIDVPVALPIDVNVSQIAPFTPTILTVTITHPASSMRYKSLGNGTAPGWSFAAQNIAPGTMQLIGTSDGSTQLTTGRLVTPLFDTYLTADTDLPITLELESPYTCLDESGDSTSISMHVVCFAQGRLVSISGIQYRLDPPRPSPASSEITVPFSIGLQGSAELQIVDATGRTVRSVALTGLVAGSYELPIPVDTLGQGAYTIRLSSGPFAAVEQFIVIR
ncbi:MAG: choice-of-anchor D domain-containing protein [Candidatus Kapabacteria bacterium]|nr:choice-of-anchor D domain-containing protein [Candidatus Kapabacteria bacterium]